MHIYSRVLEFSAWVLRYQFVYLIGVICISCLEIIRFSATTFGGTIGPDRLPRLLWLSS